MTDNQKPRDRSGGRERGKLWACALLLLLLCAMLLLVKCARIPAGRSGEGEAPSAGSEPEPMTAEPTLEQRTEPPEGWTALELDPNAISHGTLVLVNRAHGFDPDTVTTVSVWENKTGSYLVKDIYLSVDPAVMAQLNDWMDAFAEKSGRTDVNVVAGYRSDEDQRLLYDNAVRTKGQDHADRYLALPGHSEHHTGLAVDLDTYDLVSGLSGGFDGGGAYAWAAEHAWEYGFVQRYPPHKSDVTGIDYEAWHFRFVGLPHACLMRKLDLCLEEYIDYLRSFPFAGEHLSVSVGGQDYEIYYCPGTGAIVPETGTYEISGNNVDGLIVTVFD